MKPFLRDQRRRHGWSTWVQVVKRTASPIVVLWNSMSEAINLGASPARAQRGTMNPYRHAAALIADRLAWDLDFRSWRSRARLRAARNRHAGGRAIIVCNGPSLRKVDLDALGPMFCFGLNKINLIFESTRWRPSCIVAMNELVIEQNSRFYNSTDIPVFLNCLGRKHVRLRSNVVFLHGMDQDKLARDCCISVHPAYSVTGVAMQLAFHLGFSDVALIGCDHNFVTSGPANATVRASGEDLNHFDPRYFSGQVRWQLPDLPGSEYFFHRAREMFEAWGRRLWNCTDGGRLETLPRRTLEDWLKGSLE